MNTPRSLFFVLPLALTVGASGCEEYYSIDTACHPEGTVPGGVSLGTVGKDAMDRLNCYRRLSGLSRVSINTQVQLASDNVRKYIQANPEEKRIASGSPDLYLNQVFDENEYTGSNAFARLEFADYFFSDPSGTDLNEFIAYADNLDGSPPPIGPDAIDRLMRVGLFREHGLQPSWIDGGYIEIELGPQWYTAARVCELRPEVYNCVNGQVPADISGRIYYMLSVHSDPHLEKAAEPFAFPKADQTDVFLWSRSVDLDTIETIGRPLPVEIGYPITIYGGVINPENYRSSDQNVFGLIVNAAIEGPNGVIESEEVLPGSMARGRYPSGLQLRKSAVIYPLQRLEPNTDYTLFADVATNEADFQVDFSFKTIAADLGTLETTTPMTVGARTYDRHEVEAYLSNNPHRADPQRPRLPQ